MTHSIKLPYHEDFVVACTVGAEDNREATDERSVNHCMDSDRQYVLRRLSVGKVPVLVRHRVGYRLSFHNCNYGILTDWCPYSPWATHIHN